MLCREALGGDLGRVGDCAVGWGGGERVPLIVVAALVLVVVVWRGGIIIVSGLRVWGRFATGDVEGGGGLVRMRRSRRVGVLVVTSRR